MAKRSEALADQIVSLSEAAAVTGYTTTWILKLASQGHFTKSAPGKYRLGEVVQGAIKAKGGNSTYTAARERVLQARARAMELQNGINSKKYCETAYMLGLVDEVVGGMAASLHSLHVTATRDPVLREKIRLAVSDICKRTCEKRDKRAAQLLGNAPPDEEDDDDLEAEHGQS